MDYSKIYNKILVKISLIFTPSAQNEIFYYFQASTRKKFGDNLYKGIF